MPAGLSPMHLLVIMVVALVVLGPAKLPDAVRTAARFFGGEAVVGEHVAGVAQRRVDGGARPPTDGREPADLVGRRQRRRYGA